MSYEGIYNSRIVQHIYTLLPTTSITSTSLFYAYRAGLYTFISAIIISRLLFGIDESGTIIRNKHRIEPPDRTSTHYKLGLVPVSHSSSISTWLHPEQVSQHHLSSTPYISSTLLHDLPTTSILLLPLAILHTPLLWNNGISNPT